MTSPTMPTALTPTVPTALTPTGTSAPSARVPVLLSSPDVGALEEDYVLAAMRGGWIAPAGPDLDAFEAEIAQRVGVEYAVGLSSGTAALHLGLLGLGVRPGDVVVTSTFTFAATVNAIVYCGARPVFIDCDPATGNMDPCLLARTLHSLEGEWERVGAVVPVDLFGKAADYSRIVPIARAHHVPVLADAAESLGSAHAGRAAGSWGDAAAISFNGNKIMTTSGGGMLLTDDGDVAARARHLSTQAREPVAHYEHRDVGYNYRLSNLLAALGRAQLVRLDAMIARRHEIRRRYEELFAEVPGARILGGAGTDGSDNAWLTPLVVDPDEAGWDAPALGEWLARTAIETRPLWKPMHLQPVFAHARAELTGAAEHLFRHGLALPSGSALSDAEVERVLEEIRGFLGRRVR
ncbi:DegT/DnrJ/EryC1/StrS family aminotransferase [Brevibacterium jeotgali]|uniref:dTDP-4-amino-4,6-dideoxygalactose transaminase n=1 Tax=Brevibacterium jeotgali TaxID=1262550 RepID=A0A2H1L3L6_9MICO|nr:aminotransferase class I/II-fold pyridoxal phosphate-dependent enzyme [Brevibacterium jeotgali]TWC01635.1 dTDP-4-amino-4,6-dideoxygalactose transaminase [Brevibacterium jeotgali]SMY11380.1 dTDP-4-amino-4,6-dideoxygalactose transaminase [Brevibacterium jeotgali]